MPALIMEALKEGLVGDIPFSAILQRLPKALFGGAGPGLDGNKGGGPVLYPKRNSQHECH